MEEQYFKEVPESMNKGLEKIQDALEIAEKCIIELSEENDELKNEKKELQEAIKTLEKDYKFVILNKGF